MSQLCASFIMLKMRLNVFVVAQTAGRKSHFGFKEKKKTNKQTL